VEIRIDEMRPIFETVTNMKLQADRLRLRRYGVICAVDGQIHHVLLRPYPKIVSAIGGLLFGQRHHDRCLEDRCLVYYNQPWRFPSFLALTYMVSGRGTKLRTVCRALEALDAIARIKRSDAILCDVANWRISREILARWGWEPHCPSRWHRHYIKRFYGIYPGVCG
jgi:hypothetical protein